MPSTPPFSRPSRALFATAALCLALGACREDARFARREAIDPLPATLAAPAYLEPAPDAWELTRGGPAPVGRLASPDNAYAWAERAYALDNVFYEAPPDYGFDYEEIQPWAWETADDWTLYVEPLDVGNRYYYYEPGEDYPYFVRDPDYAYGFDDVGRIVVIYDVAGRLMPERYLIDRADLAGRYFTRARALREAAGRAQHRRIAEDRWFARRESLTASQASWIQAAAAQDDWRRYRRRTDERDLRRFEPDRERRVAETRRFEREWREDRGRRGDGDQGFLQRSGPDRIARADERRVHGDLPREDRLTERLFASREDRDDRRFERMTRADRAPDERREARAEGERRQDRGRAEAEARRQRDDGERRERAQADRRQDQARIEGERREQVQRERRAEGERRQARAEGERRQEQARQERGRAESERREQAQREQRAEGERRQAQARAEGERRQEQARQERGRAEARQRAEGERREQAQREQRAEGERRQAQARAEGERRQEQARQERGRAEARQRAEGERREQAQREQRAEGERRQEQARQDRARADTAERHAQPAADRQGSPDRGNRGGRAERGRDGGGEDRGQGRKKD